MVCEEGSITIPQDLIIDILRCLPIKSVGRFRCVSKEWLSLLTEPHFIKTHKKTLNNHLIFLRSQKSLYSIYSLPFDNHKAVSTLTKLPIESRIFYIEGSCNGLVLVYIHDFMRSKDTFYVLNPTIKDYVEFSTNPVVHKERYLYGFGYDSVTDDYKVVAISFYNSVYLDPPDNYDVYVYSLRSDTWRKVSDSPFGHYYHGEGLSGVFLNGFLHWITEKDYDHEVITAFGLADEKFCEVPSPYGCNGAYIFSYFFDQCKLVALGEKLAIFDDVEGVVWLMNEYGVKESWTKIVVHGFNESRMVEPMIFYDNGKIVFVNGHLKMLNNAEEKCLDKSHDVFWLKGTYIESLFLPKIGPTN